MNRDRIARRSFLSLGLTTFGGCLLLAGCGEDTKGPVVTKQDEANVQDKVKEAMANYKKSQPEKKKK